MENGHPLENEDKDSFIEIFEFRKKNNFMPEEKNNNENKMEKIYV